MKPIAGLLLFAVGLVLTTASTASAQWDNGYWFLDFSDTTGAALQPLNVGIDLGDGGGFSYLTLSDDDGDGVIRLPRVPVGGRLALGVEHAGGERGCDLWDLTSTDVVGATIQKPLPIIAEDVEG